MRGACYLPPVQRAIPLLATLKRVVVFPKHRHLFAQSVFVQLMFDVFRNFLLVLSHRISRCSTERVAEERNLIAGASTSCGCFTRERVRETQTIDYTGRRFGKLLVAGKAETGTNGAQRWKCQCDCGKECVVLASSLRTGKRTSCGCDSRKGKHTTKDVAGQKFAMLTALYPTEERSRNGSIIWHCRCDCGNEVDISLDKLKYSDVISCGCMREKCNQEIPEKLIRVAGTSIDALRSSKVRSDNKTGVKGVYIKRGKYAAAITFQQKSYYLGSYSTLEAASFIRKEAEALLHGAAVDFYEKWKNMAEADPEWAEANPIQIHVVRDGSGEFQVELLPEIENGA